VEHHMPTMPVPEAGRKYFGLSRNASYAAAARGEIPTIRIGGRLFAIVAALDRLLNDPRIRTDGDAMKRPDPQAM
jgi:hypothetical protein